MLGTAKEPNRGTSAGSLPGPDRNPEVFGWVGTGLRVHFVGLTTLAAIKCLSSYRIMTWDIHRSCIFNRSFTYRFRICDLTDTS